MTLEVIPPGPSEEVDTFVSPFDRPQKIGSKAYLGFGLLRPFRRDLKNDFANGGGIELVKACVGQVLGTRSSSEFSQGELAWHPEFGCLLHLLRHMNNDYALQELGRTYVLDALRKWEPRILVKSVLTSREDSSDGEKQNVLVLKLLYDVIGANVAGNDVILPNVEQTVRI